MGYDLVVLDVTGQSRLGHDELDLLEQFDTQQLAQAHGFPLLASLPEYWGGDVRRFSVDELRRLLLEIERVMTIDSATRDVSSAVAKLRGVAELAIKNGGTLSCLPD